MRKVILLAAAILAVSAGAALADTRTVQINSTTNRVQAIVDGHVTSPAPSGVLFVFLTDDLVKVEGGWIYDPVLKTFKAPVE